MNGDLQYDETGLAPENRLAGDLTIQTEYAGYFEALLSTYRHLPMDGREETYTRLEATGVPVQAVFGEDDQVVLIESADRLAAIAPSATITRIPKGRHGVNYQMNSATNPLLLDFFQASQQVEPSPN